MKRAGLPAERLGGEKLQATGDLVTGTPGQWSFDQQRRQGGTDRLRAQLVGGTPRDRGESCHRGARGLLGPGGQALQWPRADHRET